MMKKYFSLTLLLALVLTLVGTMPVQAELDDTYPYFFLDYNQEYVGPKTSAVWAEGQGVGGTGAFKITDRNNANDDFDVINLLDKESIQRDSYRISGWVKLVHADKLDAQGKPVDANGDGKTDQFEFNSPNAPRVSSYLSYGYIKADGTESGGGLATSFSTISVPNLADGRWHYFEQNNTKTTFTGASASTQYNWQTSKPTKFNARFITTSGSEQRFQYVFKDFAGGCELLYYIDDYQFTPVVSETVKDGSVPVVAITSPALPEKNVVGDTINISWTHSASNVAVDSKVVVRVFKKVFEGEEYASDGWALINQQFVEGDSYSFPLTAEHLGDTYKFEVFPYDITSNSYRAGAIQTVAMSGPVLNTEEIKPAATPITFASSGTGGTITFELAKVTNNTTTPLSLFTIVALYDAKGALIDCKVNPLAPITNQTLTSLTHTVTLSTDAEYNEVTLAKAFVWGGAGFDNTEGISYIPVQSQEKQ